MAPEVFKGEKYGANVDVYSLGIVMYKLLNNNLEPFRKDRTYGDGERAMELRMRGEALQKPVNADEKLAEIVLKACQYNPKERYQNPSQMREDLESINEVTSADNLHGTTGVYNTSVQENNVQNNDDTISLFKTQNSKRLTEEEIVKLAFDHEPADLSSKKGRSLAGQCLSRILPIYDATQKLSDVIKMNNSEDIKELLTKADIDTLLVCFKTLAFHISNGDDRQVLGSLQKNILESLKIRNFTISQNTNGTNIGLNEHVKPQIKKSRENSFDFNKIISGLKKEFLKKWQLWTAVFAVVILSAGAILIVMNINSGSSIGAGDMVIEYYPNIKLTDEQLKDSADNISERAKVLGADYNVKVEDGKVVLTIDENFAETVDQKKYILEMLGTDGTMCIASGYSVEMEDCKEGFTSVDVESENKDKFMNYFGDKLPENGLLNNDVKAVLENLETENIYYLHIKLDKVTALNFSDIAEKTDKQNAESGKVILELSGMFDFVRHDTLVSGGVQMDWTSAGIIIKVPNADEFFLIPTSDAATYSKCLEVLKKVLDTDSMKTGFSYSIIEEPKWEKDETLFGTYQQKDIKGEYIIALFDMGEYYSEKLDDESYQQIVDTIKDRIDALQIPYAMGYSGLYGKNLSIKMSPDYLNSDMIRFLANPVSIEFYSQYDTVYLNHQKFDIDNDANGNICLKVTFLEDKSAIISKFIDKIPNTKTDVAEDGTVQESTFNINNENVYLVVNDVTVAGTKMADLQEDSTLTFSNLLIFNKDILSNDDVPFLELLQQIDQESYLGYDWTLASIKYYKDGEYVTDNINEIPWKYKGSAVDENLKKTVESYGATVTKSFKSRNALEITVDAEEGLDFATNFMNKVEEIYKACNFDDCSYASIWFYEADAGKDSPLDAAQFEFSKLIYGAMKMNWIVFDGPEYGKYAEEVERICASNPFYKEKTDR